ncbi:N-acetylmuramoyl-L-alanine amidase [Kitasatospora sp. NPDC088134]|uniref:N-acetylmuramoyl-L-alanine amidase n=1 Tax=Kitasatospora sp. NPDC088134 TaxID=3364071 RepID=UPI0037FF2246
MPGTLRSVVALAAATVLTTVPAAAAPAPAAPAERSLQRQFHSAAAEFHVPEGLLLALSYQQTRWDSHHGEPSTTGNYNVMGLTQVDVRAVRAALAAGPGPEAGNARDDDRPARPVRTVEDGPELHTLDAAAQLLGRPAADLRTDPAQSIRGGAALLARYQRESGPPGSADPADWYAAVARFGNPGATSGSTSPAGPKTAPKTAPKTDPKTGPPASPFADRVFDTLRTGADRRTAEGRTVHLSPASHTPTRSTAGTAAGGPAECPPELGCDFRPAAYALTDPSDPGSYGNYTWANRPGDGQQIQYIVVHDTEGGFEGTIETFRNPAAQASAHYLVRSSDGHVTQLVNDRHIAWHAGNKTVNMHSIGVEHEGYAFPSDRPTWYSEQLYRSSAALVRHLADRYGVPLDREHILGHDDVPGPVQANVAGMHWDPGTFWDWSHYLELLGAPLRTVPTAGRPAVGGTVTVAPAFDATNEPPVNGTADRPENFVYLRTRPDPDAPLINGGSQNAADWTDKAVAGAHYVVADVSGEWTAIWYDGQRAWFHNPSGRSAVPDTRPGRTLLTPRAGLSSIPVYGRSYPEPTAYRPHPAITPQPVQPLSASVPAGQSYVALSALPVRSDYYYARNIDGSAPDDRTLVVGCDAYFPIRYNHRLAYLRSSDVDGGPAAPSCT